jgi:hypothetical protein
VNAKQQQHQLTQKRKTCASQQAAGKPLFLFFEPVRVNLSATNLGFFVVSLKAPLN